MAKLTVDRADFPGLLKLAIGGASVASAPPHAGVDGTSPRRARAIRDKRMIIAAP